MMICRVQTNSLTSCRKGSPLLVQPFVTFELFLSYWFFSRKIKSSLMPLELEARGKRDPTGFTINTTKLLVLIKSSGEGGGGGLLSCTSSGWVAGSCLFGLGCLGLKLNGIGPIFFDLQHSLHSLSLSPACSVHGRKLYSFPSLNLALSLLIDLRWSTLYDDLQRNGFAIEARVDNVWSHFSQFLSKINAFTTLSIYQIQYCATLVIAEIKMLRYDYKMENEHMMKNLVVAPIGKEMRYSAKFIQGCILQSNNFSWY
ncbi:uncharacterized protein LOC142619074 [Castanea sativa]|uniref:uncharacterized protein LOC142619074 n=1 Tax=Castanea sativa TaxID=21020 RepID=UPI003F6537CC